MAGLLDLIRGEPEVEHDRLGLADARGLRVLGKLAEAPVPQHHAVAESGELAGRPT